MELFGEVTPPRVEGACFSIESRWIGVRGELRADKSGCVRIGIGGIVATAIGLLCRVRSADRLLSVMGVAAILISKLSEIRKRDGIGETDQGRHRRENYLY